jgi:hypothetical protein
MLFGSGVILPESAPADLFMTVFETIKTIKLVPTQADSASYPNNSHTVDAIIPNSQDLT